MPDQKIGTCSICGGSVMGWVGPWMATVPPPPPRCANCGAVSQAHDPVIPMRPSRLASRGLAVSLCEAALATLRGQGWSDGMTPADRLTGEQVIAVYQAIELAERQGRDPARIILSIFYPKGQIGVGLSDRRIDKSLQKLKRMKLIRFDRAQRRWTTKGSE